VGFSAMIYDLIFDLIGWNLENALSKSLDMKNYVRGFLIKNIVSFEMVNLFFWLGKLLQLVMK
jgi:hypothetical protein